jgi:hypothetical protein
VTHGGGGGAVWLGMLGAQWLSLCTALFTLALLSESFLGHYRSGFAVKMQYSPFVIGLALVIALALAVAAPRYMWTPLVLRVAGWSAIALSIVGFGFHYYFGIIEKPGGHRWLLHHLMYHAPLLAPLGLAAAGGMALIVDASLRGAALFGAFPPARAMTVVVAVTLLGLLVQVAIYHYRGAFKNPVMYAPLAISLATVGIAAWRLQAQSPLSVRAYDVALWVVFLLGFSGWGWHLRGLDRMMGGLYVALPNVLEGPPPIAPLLFALLAAQGIVGEHLL